MVGVCVCVFLTPEPRHCTSYCLVGLITTQGDPHTRRICPQHLGISPGPPPAWMPGGHTAKLAPPRWRMDEGGEKRGPSLIPIGERRPFTHTEGRPGIWRARALQIGIGRAAARKGGSEARRQAGGGTEPKLPGGMDRNHFLQLLPVFQTEPFSFLRGRTRVKGCPSSSQPSTRRPAGRQGAGFWASPSTAGRGPFLYRSPEAIP